MEKPHQVSGDGSVKIGRTDTITTPRLTNQALDAANPDSTVPPLSDTGSLPAFKYPFSFANKRLYKGGWSREVTIRELQIAKELAGVNVRLEAGGVRALHWHKAAEWSIMLYGNVRLTAIDADGRSFVPDVSEGDLWFFPTGIPHSIQGLQPKAGEFLLVFDDGHFSEHETVLLYDIAAHIPREIMARNFGVDPKALDGIFKEELFIFRAPVPSPLAEDQKTAAGSLGPSQCEFSFRPGKQSIAKKTKGGEARIVDSSTFKVSTTVATAIVTVHPGGMRELHWHQNADEWQYYMSGKARMTVVGTGERARTMDFEAGGVGYIEKTLPHYIENAGDEDLRFLELFRSNRFEDLSFSEWFSHTPPGLVMAHLNIDRATYDRIPREKNRCAAPPLTDRASVSAQECTALRIVPDFRVIDSQNVRGAILVSRGRRIRRRRCRLGAEWSRRGDHARPRGSFRPCLRSERDNRRRRAFGRTNATGLCA